MLIRSLTLRNFRAHSGSTLQFTDGVNLIVGPNGAGKTNVLEAIHYLCLSKSFLQSTDQYAVRRGEGHFELDGSFSGARRPLLSVRLVCAPGEGKRVFINKSPLDRIADIVGILPVVVVSPEDHAVTSQGPEERRRFLDNILSQARPVYLDNLLKYRRTLKQRNALLARFRRTRDLTPALIEPWNEELAQLGSRIIIARFKFIHQFGEYLAAAYRNFESLGEEPSVEYVTVSPVEPPLTEEGVIDELRNKLAQAAHRERETGRTLIGPHRDELIFRLNGLEVRRYASQGQHRTFALALKLAKFAFLRDRIGENPILLLDDVFSNLDRRRIEIFLSLLQSDLVGQSIITATSKKLPASLVDFSSEQHALIAVNAGEARVAESSARA